MAEVDATIDCADCTDCTERETNGDPCEAFVEEEFIEACTFDISSCCCALCCITTTPEGGTEVTDGYS